MGLDERAQAQFDTFNAVYFNGELPDVDVRFVHDLRLDGPRRCRLLGATSKVGGQFFIELRRDHMWRLTLMHEAVHVRLWPRSHKSKQWKQEVQRLAVAGFLLEVF